MAERCYSFEALAEVTATDWKVGRGQLNAALRDIKTQSPDLEDDYLLSCEIYERAKMYRRVYPEVALTPSALSKHWLRVKEEAGKKRGGANLHAGVSGQMPPTRREQNREEVRKLKATLWGER